MKKFMRTRGAPSQLQPRDAPKTNGYANGVGTGADVSTLTPDQHSTLSRYWDGSDGSGVQAASARGALWEDEEFPPGSAALGDRRRGQDVIWLRPHFYGLKPANEESRHLMELCARPRFLGDEQLELAPGSSTSPETDDQRAARWIADTGEVGLPALACAAAALASTPRLLARTAPPHSFRSGYSGAFRFRFWVFGVWRDVLVDDRLPARQLPRLPPRLLASRSALLPDDFTLPLLEKAYAKLYGSYAAARAGGAGGAAGAAGALQELSGAVVQSFAPPRQPRALLYQVLNSAVPRSTLLVATVTPDKDNGNRRLRNGLVPSQAYLVTGLARVREAAVAGGASEVEGGGALVRLWAAGAGARGEWAGPWARDGPEWRALPPADRDLLARRVLEPGHFWMSFMEFSRAFSRLELVHVGPDDWLGEPALRGKRPWRAVLARRRWRAGYNAGGPPGSPAAHTNPQFHLSVPRAASGRCHVVVSVTQQYAVGGARGRRDERLRSVGFAVYELPTGTTPRRAALAPHLSDLRALDVTHASRAREVATFFTLPPGQYLLVPHSRAHRDAAFLLRVLTDEHTDVWEVNDDNVIIRDIAAEVTADPRALPHELQAAVTELLRKVNSDEVDAWRLRCALRATAGARAAAGRASLEVCRALVALRDPGVAGRVATRELPALLALLAAWRAAWRTYRATRCRRAVSAYELRALLWACGLTASNKVLECMVVRFARGVTLSSEAFLLALARLHLAHERYRSLDTKMKSNPLSLEEMILMTIYS